MTLGIRCSQYKNASGDAHDRIRHLRPNDVASYHVPVKFEIAWVPYKQHRLVLTKTNEWMVIKDKEADTESVMPVILISYPNGPDTLWLDMTVDNELLGRLLKHTLMTQQPITRPFTEYVEVAKCSQCHPANIPIDFE